MVVFSTFGILCHNISIQVNGQRLEEKSPGSEKCCGESWSVIDFHKLPGISGIRYRDIEI